MPLPCNVRVQVRPGMFLCAFKEVTSLMETDSFPRFKQSPLFQVESYRQLFVLLQAS